MVQQIPPARWLAPTDWDAIAALALRARHWSAAAYDAISTQQDPTPYDNHTLADAALIREAVTTGTITCETCGERVRPKYAQVTVTPDTLRSNRVPQDSRGAETITCGPCSLREDVIVTVPLSDTLELEATHD